MGFVEAVHGHIQGLARCYETQIDTNIGLQHSVTSPAISSAVRYAGFVLTSFVQLDPTEERNSNICWTLQVRRRCTCLVNRFFFDS